MNGPIIFKRHFRIVESSTPNDPMLGKDLVHGYTEDDLLKMFQEWDDYVKTLIDWAKENDLDLPAGMPDQTPRR